MEDLQKSSLKLSGEVEDLSRKLEKNIQVNKEKEMEVSALTAERDGLKHEVEKLKSTKHASRDLESGTDESRWVTFFTQEGCLYMTTMTIRRPVYDHCDHRTTFPRSVERISL